MISFKITKKVFAIYQPKTISILSEKRQLSKLDIANLNIK